MISCIRTSIDDFIARVLGPSVPISDDRNEDDSDEDDSDEDDSDEEMEDDD